MTIKSFYHCLIISILCFFSGCKKKENNKRTIGEQEAYKAESGLIYYVPDTSVVLSDDEQLTYGPSTENSTWLQNKLAWVVLPTQGYPQLSKFANTDGELTLAVHLDDIIDAAGFSLSKVDSTGTHKTIKSKQDNYQKMEQYRHELIENQKKLIEIKSEEQTSENLKIQSDIEQKIHSLEKTIDKETSQFINPNDPAKNLDISDRIEETMFRLRAQISDLEQKQSLETKTVEKNKKNAALRFFENMKSKYSNSTPTQKFLWAGAFTSVTTVITLAAVLSGDDEPTQNSAPQIDDANNSKATISKEPTPTETSENTAKNNTETSDSDKNIPIITQDTSDKAKQANTPSTPNSDKQNTNDTQETPRFIRISFKEGAKGYLATREFQAKKGIIDLSFSFILKGSFDATYTGFALQCPECFEIKTKPSQ